MRLTQKLEINAALAASLITFLSFCLFMSFIVNLKSKPSDSDGMAMILLFVWMLTLMAVAGAYFDATKRSNIALAALCIGGIIVIIITGLFGMVVFAWGGVLFGLMLLCIAVLSLVMILLALKGRLELPSMKKLSHEAPSETTKPA